MRRAEPVAQRIKRRVVVDANGCWIWQGAKQNGYGRMSRERRSGLKAHRVSYEAFVGPIFDGMDLDHLCRVRACVNPDHLEPVSRRVNLQRSPLTPAGRRTCPRGHEYADEPSYRGYRECRTCRRAYYRLRRLITPEQRAARKAAGVPVVDLDAYFSPP